MRILKPIARSRIPAHPHGNGARTNTAFYDKIGTIDICLAHARYPDRTPWIDCLRTQPERIKVTPLMPSPKTRAAVSKSRPAPAADPAIAREASLDDLDDRSRALLTAYMLDYEVKKGEIDDLEAALEAIKLDKIEPLRLRLGLTKIDSERWYIARRSGKKSLDKDKVKLYLVNKGVSVKLVTTAFDLATSTGKPFTEIKRKKGM